MELKGHATVDNFADKAVEAYESITWSWKCDILSSLTKPLTISRIHYMELKDRPKLQSHYRLLHESITWSWKVVRQVFASSVCWLNPLHGVESLLAITTHSSLTMTSGIHYMELKASGGLEGVLTKLSENPLHGVERSERKKYITTCSSKESITWSWKASTRCEILECLRIHYMELKEHILDT